MFRNLKFNDTLTKVHGTSSDSLYSNNEYEFLMFHNLEKFPKNKCY